jgi:acyl transferase domain-containing protein
LQQLNPHLSLDGTPFFIPGECQPWPSDRLLAGVSAFSFGGTNSHLILEAAPEESRGAGGIFQVERSLHLLTLSAKNETALQELAQRYADFFAADADVSLADVCFSANTGRSHFAHRLAIVAESSNSLLDETAYTQPALFALEYALAELWQFWGIR